MKFEKLRLIGFKSFVEPTEFHYEPGLTGIVGPNGAASRTWSRPCAGSWARARQVDARRRHGRRDLLRLRQPAVAQHGRGRAVVDNAERTAPAAFNDPEQLEISRRIEREHGSTYRINGREVRARDVQLLFADASTGARSPASCARARSARSSRPSRSSAGGSWRRRPASPACIRAGTRPSCGCSAAEQNLERLEDVLQQIDRRSTPQAPGPAGVALSQARRARSARPKRCSLICPREAARAVAEAERQHRGGCARWPSAPRAQAEARRDQAWRRTPAGPARGRGHGRRGVASARDGPRSA